MNQKKKSKQSNERNTKNSSNNHNGPKQQFNKYIRYSNIGIQMLLIIGVGVWGGMQLDERLHTRQPYFTIILSLLAVMAAIVIVIRSVLNDQ